ncbi:hypothetical protein ACF1G0_23040 [Streptomyces sp. NPDC013953]|uniref:hypothetical protein n=1 Tax=Streptomyces sp. NPDC013953 TaxID=3364868 RepID=UPI003701B0E8
MDMALWLLLACGSACMALSAFLPAPASRMGRIDTLELRRRRRMIEVLAANACSSGGSSVHRLAPEGAAGSPE